MNAPHSLVAVEVVTVASVFELWLTRADGDRVTVRVFEHADDARRAADALASLCNVTATARQFVPSPYR